MMAASCESVIRLKPVISVPHVTLFKPGSLLNCDSKKEKKRNTLLCMIKNKIRKKKKNLLNRLLWIGAKVSRLLAANCFRYLLIAAAD